MAQQQMRRGGTSSAFLWGGVFGTFAILFNIIGRFLAIGRAARVPRVVIRPLAGGILVGILLPLAVLCCFFVAGLLAARRAGRVEPGIFAGLIAGGIVGAGTLVVAIASTAMVRHGVRIGGIGAPRLAVVVLATALGSLAASAVVGTGIGALGALVGRPRGNTMAAGWSYPYQAGPVASGVGGGPTPGAMPYASGGAYPLPTSPNYAAEGSMPTIQTDSTPPAP